MGTPCGTRRSSEPSPRVRVMLCRRTSWTPVDRQFAVRRALIGTRPWPVPLGLRVGVRRPGALVLAGIRACGWRTPVARHEAATALADLEVRTGCSPPTDPGPHDGVSCVDGVGTRRASRTLSLLPRRPAAASRFSRRCNRHDPGPVPGREPDGDRPLFDAGHLPHRLPACSARRPAASPRRGARDLGPRARWAFAGVVAAGGGGPQDAVSVPGHAARKSLAAHCNAPCGSGAAVRRHRATVIACGGRARYAPSG